MRQKLYIFSVPHSLFSWYHYVMTLDGSVLKGYLNGELKATRTDVPTSGTNTYVLTIGGWGGIFLSKGIIGVVRIYNRALSAEEIKAHYEAEKARFGL